MEIQDLNVGVFQNGMGRVCVLAHFRLPLYLIYMIVFFRK